MKFIRETAWFLLFSTAALASGTTGKQLDTVHHSGGGSVLSVPSTGSAVLSDTASATVTNKTISGGSNTLSQLPIAAQTTQVVVTPFPNGSATSFTLSTAPGGNAAVQLYLDGTQLVQGSGLDYTISGSTITMTTAPATGQRLYAVYSQF